MSEDLSEKTASRNDRRSSSSSSSSAACTMAVAVSAAPSAPAQRARVHATRRATPRSAAFPTTSLTFHSAPRVPGLILSFAMGKSRQRSARVWSNVDVRGERHRRAARELPERLGRGGVGHRVTDHGSQPIADSRAERLDLVVERRGHEGAFFPHGLDETGEPAAISRLPP